MQDYNPNPPPVTALSNTLSKSPLLKAEERPFPPSSSMSPAMVGSAFVRSLNDITLKPRLLLRLIGQQVLDVKRPFQSSSELIEEFKPLVDEVLVHNLLFESAPESTDTELVKSWKSAVDAWVDRVLGLLSSDISDKSLAGVWLLGLTCRECCSNRFSVSYEAWLNKLLHIQSSTRDDRIKVASCAAVSDLVRRLSGVRTSKDGIVLVGKVIPPTVKLLNEDDAAAAWEAAVHLLCTIIHCFPSSVIRHYDSVEAVLISKILSVHSSAKLLTKLAHCLALLPRVRGSEDLMLKRLLFSINIHLDDALESLEEELVGKAVVSDLWLPGSDHPPSLGELSNKATRRSRQLLLRIVTTFVQCLCTILSGSYPVQVDLCIPSILATIRRVLVADGSVPSSLQPFTTSTQQEVACAQLPVLQQCGLDILTAMLRGVGSQLVLYAAEIARLLILHLNKCAFPEQRIQLYFIVKDLLVSMGAGVMPCLAEAVTGNAHTDLNSGGSTEGYTSTEPMLTENNILPPLRPCNKKRKHRGGTVSSNTQQNGTSLELEATGGSSKLIALKIAALRALEALLRTGGAMGPDGWRSKVDDLVFVIAKNALRKGSCSKTDFQLAALDALLASLLAPAPVRPKYLSQGLKLFRDGSQLAAPEIANTCSCALFFLEPLIHPRALPLQDFPPPKTNTSNLPSGGFYGSTNPGAQNSAPPFSDVPDTSNDPLYSIYMEKDEDPPAPAPAPKSQTTQHQTSEERISDATATVNDNDKMMTDSEEPGGVKPRQGVTLSPPVSGSSAADKDLGKAVLNDHSGADVLAGASHLPVSEGKSAVLSRADDGTLKVSVDVLDDDDDDSCGSPLPKIEVDFGSDSNSDGSGSD